MRTVEDLSEAERRVLDALREGIAKELLGCGFRMTLFGSRARGDAEQDSDMDILLEVDSERLLFDAWRRLSRLAGEVSIESEIVVSLLIVDQETKRERGEFSTFDNIREEGISV